MNKKGQGLGIAVVVLLVIVVGGLGFIGWNQGWFSAPAQTAVQQTEAVKQTAQDLKSGDVATIGVYVRDISQTDVNTKVAVPIYCHDGDSFILDGTNSSTTAETTGKTAFGKTITCHAFTNEYDTLEPTVVTVDEEYEHVLIDAYLVSTSGTIKVYDDTLTTDQNISVGADTSATYDKLRFKNTATTGSGWYPLGGIYMDTKTAGTNISEIEMSGSATLYGFDHSSASFVLSDLSTKVSSRKEQWDYVFEVDDNSELAGNQLLLVEENDYIDSGSVTVTADGDGCSGASDEVDMYAFAKGHYRSTKTDTIGFGHENDASSATQIAPPITGDDFWCTA